MQKIIALPAQRPDEARQGPRHNLPAQLTSLIGREHDITEVCALLRRSEVRLLTLTGTGGVGKTRLGLQMATELLHDFGDGVCLVSLATISDPNLVVPTIAQILGLQVLKDQSPLEQLKAYLRDKQKLLLLDNFEQVTMAAPLLVELLQACPQLKVMVTSRTILRVRGEYVFLVPPLAIPDLHQLPHLANYEEISQTAAVALFIERAQIIKSDFVVTKVNAQTIAEICSRLDGLPLAIELAATKIKLLTPQKLLARLEHRLQLLIGGAYDLPKRQQTMRRTLQWSYDLLNVDEQKLFRRLSIFVDGFTLEAAEALCSGVGHLEMDVLDGVTALVDKNLLRQVEQEGQELRLLMLGTIREFAMELLVDSGELTATQHAYITYYLTLAQDAERGKDGSQQVVEVDFASTMVNGRTMLIKQITTTHTSATVPKQTSGVMQPNASESPTSASPEDLTTREVEVLRLVAMGLTNHQIAERFTISRLTVKAHPRSIYSKLGITSRSAATRYAIEHKHM